MTQSESSPDDGVRRHAVAAGAKGIGSTPGAAQCGPLLNIAEPFGTSLGLLPFDRIVQDAPRRLVVGAAAKSSAPGLGLDLFRGTGKNALRPHLLIAATKTLSSCLRLRLLGRVGQDLAATTTGALVPVGATATAATASGPVLPSVAPF